MKIIVQIIWLPKEMSTQSVDNEACKALNLDLNKCSTLLSKWKSILILFGLITVDKFWWTNFESFRAFCRPTSKYYLWQLVICMLLCFKNVRQECHTYLPKTKRKPFIKQKNEKKTSRINIPFSVDANYCFGSSI